MIRRQVAPPPKSFEITFSQAESLRRDRHLSREADASQDTDFRFETLGASVSSTEAILPD
jgi:hypothetical protein